VGENGNAFFFSCYFFLKFVFKAVSPGEMISLTCIFLV